MCELLSSNYHCVSALACVQEMQAMFACWKKYDHNELKCSKELQAFEKCHQVYLVSHVYILCT